MVSMVTGDSAFFVFPGELLDWRYTRQAVPNLNQSLAVVAYQFGELLFGTKHRKAARLR
jgi:hypothetical protein